MFPQFGQLIYFLKDFILAGAYLKFYFFYSKKKTSFPYGLVISVLAWLMFFWGIISALNCGAEFAILSIIGIKSYLFYIPLMWMLPYLFPDEEGLLKFLRTYFILLLPVGALALLQFFSSPDSPLNVYAWQDGAPGVALSGSERVRATGTFSYIFGYTSYLLFCFSWFMPVFTFRARASLHRLILNISEFIAIAAPAFMTGGRRLVISLALILSGFIIIPFFYRLKVFIKSFGKLFLIFAAGLVIFSFLFMSAFTSFWERFTNNQDIRGRIENSLAYPLKLMDVTGAFGYGPGATFMGKPFILKAFNMPEPKEIPVFYEEEPERVFLELGFIGFFLWYLLRLVLLFALWNTYRRLKDNFLSQMALMAFLVQVTLLNAQVAMNHICNLLFWFSAGFVFLLPYLNKQKALK